MLNTTQVTAAMIGIVITKRFSMEMSYFVVILQSRVAYLSFVSEFI